MTQPTGIDEGLRIMLTIPEAARRLSLGRSTLYKLLACGAIECVYIGHARRIPLDCLIEFVEECRRTQHQKRS
jgi:excisionase family DNA binding protein